MDRVSLDLKNCYGIKSLKYDFDFSEKRAYAIYAPNGVMKSSLAETFFDASEGKESTDRIFKDRKAERHITDENGAEIGGERILVIRSYDEAYGPTDKTSALLVSDKLRRESEQLEAKVQDAKAALLRAIKAQAGTKRDLGAELSVSVTRYDDQLEEALIRLQREVVRQTEAPFTDVKYDIIFNDKVLKALDDKKLMERIEDFVKKYNELLEKSHYFRKGTFDYYNADTIAKSLASNGFFNANHTVNLYGSEEPVEVKTQKQLLAIIEEEKQLILTDAALMASFNEVQALLGKNAELKAFCHYLQDNFAVLSKMTNVEAFRQDVFKSYLKANESLYLEVLSVIESVDVRRREILEEARQQTTEWDTVLKIFNERFYVPFELTATNKLPVMLGQVDKPLLGFKYSDGREEVDISKADLLKVLSMGERRALYLINVIFEVRRRMTFDIETLVVVDDIADSFDYNNKYAIIQYLQEITKKLPIKLIIMTHNFDFFRTVQSRFVKYDHCLMATKDPDGITLVKAEGIQNVFGNDWKDRFFKDSRKQIASIPFLRNIIEMTHGKADQRYLDLTSMLHLKANTSSLTLANLDEIFNSVCEPKGESAEPSKKVIDLIMAEADACVGEAGAMKLENKIVLAIGIRLAAERYIIGKIKADEWVATIKKAQTRKLIDRFREDFKGEDETLRVLDRVELMTPENIHVNAFMYEPLIDMSDQHLRKLYEDVKALT